MAFEIVLCNNNSERNKLDKSLSGAYTVEGVLRDNCSIINPVFEIEATNAIGYNYCYIPDFSRYYYIADVKSMHNNLWEITLRVDVLMSFQNDILNTVAIIDHTTQQDITDYMESNVWQSLVKDKTDIINFSSGLSESGGYILITAGG